MSRRAFFFGLLIVALLIISLYRAKYGARDTAAELMAVEAQIESARQEKALLETELTHMSRRDWIEEYAREELGMAPPSPEQMAREDDIDRVAGPVVKGAPEPVDAGPPAEPARADPQSAPRVTPASAPRLAPEPQPVTAQEMAPPVEDAPSTDEVEEALP
jgi:cell division protein FtsL